jgi:uncharacterized membrane protein YuzA (DUF378 family)
MLHVEQIMKNLVALLLIVLGGFDIYAIGAYKLVDGLYDVNAPFNAVMVFFGIPAVIIVIGFCLLVSDNNKEQEKSRK